MRFYSIKTERRNYISINHKERSTVAKLLRRAKLDGDKTKAKVFAEMLYSGKLIEDKTNKEKDEFYTLLVLSYALQRVDELSEVAEILRIKLIDSGQYFNYDMQDSYLIAEDTEAIKISSTSGLHGGLQELENYPEELEPFIMDLFTKKICKVNDSVISILKNLGIKFKKIKLESYVTEAKKSISKALCELVIWLKKYQKIVMFSGGKDSTAMLVRLIEEGEDLDKIVFADTGLEFPEMYQYIKRVQDYIKREITIVKGDVTFDDWFYGTFTRGKNVGHLRGFPKVIGLGCWAKRELKIKPLQRAEGRGNKIFIGIAADEKERTYRAAYQYSNIYRFPLVDWNMTGQDNLEFLQARNLENPLYEIFHRLGCWLCPKQGLKSLKSLYRYYPVLWEKLKEYEKDSPTGFKIRTTVRELEERFKKEIWLEKSQLSLIQSLGW